MIKPNKRSNTLGLVDGAPVWINEPTGKPKLWIFARWELGAPVVYADAGSTRLVALPAATTIHRSSVDAMFNQRAYRPPAIKKEKRIKKEKKYCNVRTKLIRIEEWIRNEIVVRRLLHPCTRVVITVNGKSFVRSNGEEYPVVQDPTIGMCWIERYKTH